MGPDAENYERETSGVTRPVVVMIEHASEVRAGQLVGLGRRRAHVRIQNRLDDGERLVLTVSMPEPSAEKTQAIFRLESEVRRERDDDGESQDHDLVFASDSETLGRALELYTLFQARGFVED